MRACQNGNPLASRMVIDGAINRVRDFRERI
jgi:hypothetical protein